MQRRYIDMIGCIHAGHPSRGPGGASLRNGILMFYHIENVTYSPPVDGGSPPPLRFGGSASLKGDIFHFSIGRRLRRRPYISFTRFSNL